MITRREVEWSAEVDPVVIALYLEAKGWKRAQTPPDWGVQRWEKKGCRVPLVQYFDFPSDYVVTRNGMLLHDLSAEENRSPQAILWDWQATPYSRLRLTCFPRLRVDAGASLLALCEILAALQQGVRQAALQVERSGQLPGFLASIHLTSLQVLPHETVDYDLMIGSADPTAGPVWSEFLALLGRPATAITPRRELELGELHLVLEPLRQAMKAGGITELSGVYLQAGEPNVHGLGLPFRLDVAGTLLLGGDD